MTSALHQDPFAQQEQALTDLVNSFSGATSTVPAKLTDFMLLGDLECAADPELLLKEHGVTHIFSCIHSIGEMCIADDVARLKRRRRDAEISAKMDSEEDASSLLDAGSMQEAIRHQQELDAEENTAAKDFSLSDFYAADYGITYRGVDADDQDGYSMLEKHGQEFFDFCEAALAGTKMPKIYVHCAMGMNRSACLCVAYLMKRKRESPPYASGSSVLTDTLRHCLEKRGQILTNGSFRRQLLEFEAQL